ncbi:MAG: hypothetical protein Ct9H90mP16_11560 [Candidatus Poseidoniales archaeon]|nr:MAG: hypothetical protein Ct9H90mP16_11560 [Candidatus Poseidoniales archaeon]
MVMMLSEMLLLLISIAFSDWFFVLARWVGMVLGESETLWVPLGKRMLD